MSSRLILYIGGPCRKSLSRRRLSANRSNWRATYKWRVPVLRQKGRFCPAGHMGNKPDHLVGDECEPSFNLMEPGATRGGEVEVEPPSLLGLEPALGGRALMGAVVIPESVTGVTASGRVARKFPSCPGWQRRYAPPEWSVATSPFAEQCHDSTPPGGGQKNHLALAGSSLRRGPRPPQPVQLTLLLLGDR